MANVKKDRKSTERRKETSSLAWSVSLAKMQAKESESKSSVSDSKNGSSKDV